MFCLGVLLDCPHPLLYRYRYRCIYKPTGDDFLPGGARARRIPTII